MKRHAAIWALALCMLALAPALASADECDSTYAQNMARQGYQYLSAQRWEDARVAAGQLALYARGCSDPKVGYPSIVYSAYIGSVALHGLGNDGAAAQAALAATKIASPSRNARLRPNASAQRPAGTRSAAKTIA